MKINRVFTNNHKKVFVVETKQGVYEFPYSELKRRPSLKDPIVDVYADPEIGKQGFSYQLKSGAEGTVLLDEILFLNRDPELMRKHLLFQLSCDAQKLLASSGLTKRILARRMGVKPAQLYRLLDQTFYRKTLDQMLRLLSALGHDVELRVRRAA